MAEGLQALNADGTKEDVNSTSGSLHVVPGSAVSVDVNAGITADVDAAVAAATGLRLMGYSVRESDATPAVASCDIVNGATGAAGTDLAYIELAASSGDSQWFGPDGLDASGGISVDYIAGTMDLVLYYKVVA